MSSGQRLPSPRPSPRSTSAKVPLLPLAVAFGNTVRQLREEAGWTQEAFADHCGFFRTYLSRIETGKANPTLNVIEVISKAIDLRSSKLLGLAEKRQFNE